MNIFLYRKNIFACVDHSFEKSILLKRENDSYKFYCFGPWSIESDCLSDFGMLGDPSPYINLSDANEMAHFAYLIDKCAKIAVNFEYKFKKPCSPFNKIFGTDGITSKTYDFSAETFEAMTKFENFATSFCVANNK